MIDPSDWDLAAAGVFLLLMLWVAATYALTSMHAAYL